jgi:methionyl-tRNA synthetase
MNKEKYYITTAIPYCSAKPHIGNVYEVILADAIARYKRQKGYDVFFLTGTDEHGLKIENAAKEAGLTPQEYTDNICEVLKNIWNMVGASYDKFIRTTDDYHEKAVADIFEKLLLQGDIYKGKYEGWYCIPDESFYTDMQIVDGKCPDCGRPVVRSNEEAYFFKLSKYADRLIRYLDENQDFIQPISRKNEMLNNFIKPGLQDLCVSRTSFTWGVKVPSDPKHVVYVWIDALTNYITALGYNTKNPTELYKKYWPCDLHVIGKDIVRFHTIYWPIILMALEEPLPKTVYGHGWLNSGGDKMSKSKGNVMFADELIKKFGVDGVRYYCLAEMPFSSDGIITSENIIAKYNADLANNLGNLVSRTISMNKKYFDKIIPEAEKVEAEQDIKLKIAFTQTIEIYSEKMDSYRISEAIESIFVALSCANKYIDECSPWILAKDKSRRSRLGTVIYNSLESIRIAAVLLMPFIPESSKKILNLINTKESSLEFGKLKSGELTKENEILFSRIDNLIKM